MILLFEPSCHAHPCMRHGNFGDDTIGCSLDIGKRLLVHLFLAGCTRLDEDDASQAAQKFAQNALRFQLLATFLRL